MIKQVSLFVALSLLGAACKTTEKETPSGLKYTVIKAGEGAVGKKNDILVFDFQMKDSKDSVWNDSYKEGMPAAIEIRDSSEMKNEDDITQMLRFLNVGDSVKTTMTIPKFFKNRPVPPGIDSTLSITFTIKAKEIMTMEQFMKWRETKMIEKVSKTKAKDEETIKKYLADNKIDAKRDTSGIYYVITSSTGAAKPTAENCVVVKYEGKSLSDGITFDKNDKIQYPLNRMIRGWQLGIPMLSIGDSGKFFIPSGLGYGPQGNNGIAPDAILVFDVTLIDFKNTFDQATGACK